MALQREILAALQPYRAGDNISTKLTLVLGVKV